MAPPASTPSSMSRSSAPRVPPPLPVTYRGYLATFEDALYLLEACRRGVLPRTTKRLSTDEKRRAVFHGAIYLFLEEESGIKRWTDKVDWSASRIAGQFLIYREIHNPAAVNSSKDTSAAKDASTAAINPAALPATPTSVSAAATHVPCDASDEDEVSLAPSTASSLAVPAKLTTPACAMARKNGFVIKPNGLIKRTISLQCDGATHHIVSYCFPDQVDDLPRPSMDTRLAHLPLPESVQPLLKKSSSGGSSKSSQAGGTAGPLSSSSADGRLRPIACGGSNAATPLASPMMTPDHGTASFADVAAMHDMILHQLHQAHQAMDASTSPMLAPPWSGPSSMSSLALPPLYGPTSTMPLDSPALMDVDMTMAAATAAALAAASALQGSAPMTPLPDMMPLAPSTATSLLCTPPSTSASPTANLWEMIASAPSVSHPPSVGMPPQRSWTGESMSSAAPSLYSPKLGDAMAHAVSCSPTMMAVDSPPLEPDFATIVAAAHAAAAAMQHSPAPTTMSSSPGGAHWPDAPQPMHLDTYPAESGMDDSTAAVIAAAACLARELVALPPPMGSMPATPTATTSPAWHEPASYHQWNGHATTSPPAHQFWHGASAFAPEQPPFAADPHGMVGLGIQAPVPVHAPINGGAAAYFGEDAYGRPHPVAPAP
ncbi:hypothetical protein GGF31_008053 [Allomyces arbusculus]|nr:hypothetical protein GGF31_008053 [Allomyces arbusculus]